MATLSAARYLLGVVELLLLAGFAGFAGERLRRWLVPILEGPPAWLAAAVMAAALLIWSAEALGTFGALGPVPLLLLLAVIAAGAWKFVPPRGKADYSPVPRQPGARGIPLLTVAALLVAALALAHFAWEGRGQIGSGMTGFDSTWYHGPFAAGFFQGGNTWELHLIAPQFLAWFYPANSELFHATGMLVFGRDLLSPLLNTGWFVGCLLASWCIGRPYRVAPWSMALGAVALSVPALADQAGEARNDIVGIFFLLAAVAIALNAWKTAGKGDVAEGPGGGRISTGAVIVAALAIGLAAGTKLNFLLPAAIFVLGLAIVAPRGGRWRTLLVAALAAFAGGGYWYLRNLAHAGNPLPWIGHLGPLSLPSPGQSVGGREAHSVLEYVGDGAIWSDWFLPGLRDGLWALWPLVLIIALAGLVLCLLPSRGSAAARKGERHGEEAPRHVDPVLVLAGLVGLATAVAWLVAPTSASGPAGAPRGFESGLRYLAPALVLGLALLPTAPLLRRRLVAVATRLPSVARGDASDNRAAAGRRRGWALGALAVLVGIAAIAGYAYQRHYLENRYADPSFAAPGLNAAFAWARDVSGARVATTSTRQYPLFGNDLSNGVRFLGEERPHGGFVAPTTCRRYRQLLDDGDYDYVVTTWDRLDPNKPNYPPQTKWTESPQAKPVLRKPPTTIFKLSGPLDPSECRG